MEEIKKSKESELVTLSDGRKVAIDRSVGIVMLAYVELDGNIYILANKRGKKTSEFKQQWNLPSGYLNWNETGEEGAIRETLEETGIDIPLDLVSEIEHSTSPKENRQNVIFRYIAKLPDKFLEKDFKAIDSEEVNEIAWINYHDLDNYEWAFNQKETIIRIISNVKENYK